MQHIGLLPSGGYLYSTFQDSLALYSCVHDMIYFQSAVYSTCMYKYMYMYVTCGFLNEEL